MAANAPSKPAGRLSLYANLLDSSSTGSSAPGTISRAPVVFKPSDDASKDEAAAQKQQISAAALRFQPTKRPQIASQKPSFKALHTRAAPLPSAPLQAVSAPEPSGTTVRSVPKTSIADWTGDPDDEDVNGFYGGEKRQRGGRKKRKKNKEDTQVPQNWDDIYDPSRPNSYEEYKNSDERIREVREWKDRLYAHRISRRRNDYSESEDEARSRPPLRNQFAPPGMSFAPPSDLCADPSESAMVLDDAADVNPYPRRAPLPQAQNTPTQLPIPSSTSTIAVALPPQPLALPKTEVLLQAQGQLSVAHPFSRPTPDISRAPVRYSFPPPPADIPKSEAELENALQEEAASHDQGHSEDAPRSLRPGQKGFAERLMNKYGWTKGSGLGASGTGIVSALRVQVEKQKKKPDSEGGGFVGPGGRGKIVGGKRNGGEEGGKFGPMSEVIVLLGMVDGMDLEQELVEGDLMQEIGEECGDKYGRVERVFIDRSNGGSVPVFVKFTSQLSALRAVNALEGRVFNGNTIVAKFFDKDEFEKGVYTL